MRRFTITRDWRIRTLVPVVVINLASFATLFLLMYHFAVSNMIRAEKTAGAVLLDQLRVSLPDLMHDTSGERLHTRMRREAVVHNLADFNIFDSHADPVMTVFGAPPSEVVESVRRVLTDGTGATEWIMAPGERTLLIGVSPLTTGGALQLSFDLTAAMTATSSRVKRQFALAGAAWAALLALMFWAGGHVIGRPLKRIQTSVRAENQDLEALANGVHERIWTLIEQGRQREDDIKRQMARAEQLAALGELAAGLTHEIKNPVAGVIGALEVMRSDPDSVSPEMTDQILGELRRVASTLDSLLRLAKPQPPQRTPVDLAKAVRDLSSIFAARFRRQGVVLETECGEGIPVLSLDAGLIAQLIVNLLTNSLQATERGGQVKIIVAPFPRRDGAVLAVSDTGGGIPPETLDHIFDPFFTTKEAGTGLGLAICKQIVEQHGGTIDIESEVGKGTRVLVLLPRTEAEEIEEVHAVAAAG